IRGERSSAKAAAGETRVRPQTVALPVRNSARRYPRIGVVDGGISPQLADWVIGEWDLIAAGDADLDHGTFIAGLAVAGGALNTPAICGEPDGAELIDIAVYPTESDPDAFGAYYPYGVTQFLDEVESAIADAKARQGVR